MAKKATVLVKAFDVATSVLTLKYPQVGKVLVCDVSKYDEARRKEAEGHGWLQRFGDLESGDKVGRQKYEAAKALHEHLSAGGDWNMPVERDTAAIVIEAVHRLHPKKYSIEALTKAAEKKPEQVSDWRANAQVKSMIAQIRAEKAKAAAKDAEAEEIVIEM